MKFWKCNFYQDEEEYLLEISEISTLYKEQRKDYQMNLTRNILLKF